MKKQLYLLLLIFAPVIIYGQVGKMNILLSENVQDSLLGTSIVLKNSEIIFQKTYDVDLLKSELIEKLKNHLPTIKNFQLTESPNQTNDQFSGKFADYIVNYRKYGGSLMNTLIALNYPLTANVIVQVKDYKYRVTVSNLLFKNVQTMGQSYDILLDDGMTKAKRTKITTNSTVIKAGGYINQELTELFDINKKVKINDF